MADGVRYELTGIKEYVEALKLLPLPVGKRVLASTGKYAMAPVLDDAKRLAPVRTGVLRDSLRLVATSSGSSETGAINAGVTVHQTKLTYEIEGDDGETEIVKLNKRLDASWRWHFAEYGTSHSAAHPFIRPALDQNVSNVLARLQQKFGESVEKAFARVNLRIKRSIGGS